MLRKDLHCKATFCSTTYCLPRSSCSHSAAPFLHSSLGWVRGKQPPSASHADTSVIGLIPQQPKGRGAGSRGLRCLMNRKAPASATTLGGLRCHCPHAAHAHTLTLSQLSTVALARCKPLAGRKSKRSSASLFAFICFSITQRFPIILFTAICCQLPHSALEDEEN